MKGYVCLEWQNETWEPITVYLSEDQAQEWMNETNTANRDYREINIVDFNLAELSKSNAKLRNSYNDLYTEAKQTLELKDQKIKDLCKIVYRCDMILRKAYIPSQKLKDLCKIIYRCSTILRGVDEIQDR